MDIAVRSLTCLTATGTHMPYRITQCYLPSGRGDIPAFTPAEAGTRLTDPGGMQGWVDLVGWLHTEMVYPPKMVTHPSTNRARRALTSFMWRTPLTAMLHRHSLGFSVVLEITFNLCLCRNEIWNWKWATTIIWIWRVCKQAVACFAVEFQCCWNFSCR